MSTLSRNFCATLNFSTGYFEGKRGDGNPASQKRGTFSPAPATLPPPGRSSLPPHDPHVAPPWGRPPMPSSQPAAAPPETPRRGAGLRNLHSIMSGSRLPSSQHVKGAGGGSRWPLQPRMIPTAAAADVGNVVGRGSQPAEWPVISIWIGGVCIRLTAQSRSSGCRNIGSDTGPSTSRNHSSLRGGSGSGAASIVTA
jgi:hypothetical protein